MYQSLRMVSKIDILKGVHPGKIIERDLTKMHISQRALSLRADVSYQTINNIIAGTRGISTDMALKIEKTLGYDEGFLSVIQTYYDIEAHKSKLLEHQYQGKPNIRKSLFWDADFEKIHWGKFRNSVIKRVLERGNDDERKEIIRFYKLNDDEINQISLHK